MLDKISWKKLLLVRFEIVGVFLNTLNANDKYSRGIRENLPQQIQTQLSEKPKTFSGFFIAFLKSTSKSEYVEKRYESHRLNISKIIDCEKGCYLNV